MLSCTRTRPPMPHRRCGNRRPATLARGQMRYSIVRALEQSKARAVSHQGTKLGDRGSPRASMPRDLIASKALITRRTHLPAPSENRHVGMGAAPGLSGYSSSLPCGARRSRRGRRARASIASERQRGKVASKSSCPASRLRRGPSGMIFELHSAVRRGAFLSGRRRVDRQRVLGNSGSKHHHLQVPNFARSTS